MKKFFLVLWPRPTSKWLERMLDNEGMQKDFAEEMVVNALRKGRFSEKDLELLRADLKHSSSHTKYNSATNNGTAYDQEAYERYVRLYEIVRDFKG